MVRNGRLLRIQPLRRCIQQTEALRRNPGDDLGSNATPRPCLTNNKKAPRASHGGKNGIRVDRPDSSQVDNLDVLAVLGKFLCCRQGLVNHGTVSNHRRIPTRAGDPCLAEG